MGCSFVQMRSAEVIKLAEATIARIEKYRRDSWTHQVNREREKEEKSWTRRLFGRPVRSDEDILQSLKQEWYLAAMIDGHATNQEYTAYDLIRVAERADVVNVSADDLRAIGG